MAQPIATDGISIPDALMDQHFSFPEDGLDGGGDTDVDGGGTDLDLDDTPPAGGGADTPAGKPGSGAPDADTGDDEGEDEEGGEDDEDEGDETDTGTAPPAKKGDTQEPPADPEAEAFFDRKEWKKKLDSIEDPEARKMLEGMHKGMQAAFTRATTQAAEVRQQAEGFAADYEDFVADLATEEGATGFLHTVAEARPQVFTEELLVSVALSQPEVFEAVVERLAKIQEDPRERRDFERDLKDGAREREETAAEAHQQRQRQRELQRQLDGVVTARAGTHGLHSQAALEIVNRAVHALLQTNARAKKKTTRADVEAEVDKAAGLLRSERDDARKQESAADRKRKQEEAKRLADKSRRRTPADQRNPTADERGKNLDPAKLPKDDEGRLGGLVDQYFG